MDKKNRIENAKAKWNEIKDNAADVKSVIELECYFELNADDEAKISPYVDEYLLAYVGVENSKILFILTPDKLDDIAWDDLSQAEQDAILLKPYKTDHDVGGVDFVGEQVDGPDISVREALERHHRWNSMLKSFLEAEVQHPKGLFVRFDIPWGNVKTNLTNPDLNRMLFTFGLPKDNEGLSVSGYYTDLVGWSVMKENKPGGGTTNVSLPCPPNCKK
ncbi:MAG: hypothetical protein ACLFM1_00490 [Bacteroidales bacterium]